MCLEGKSNFNCGHIPKKLLFDLDSLKAGKGYFREAGERGQMSDLRLSRAAAALSQRLNHSKQVRVGGQRQVLGVLPGSSLLQPCHRGLPNEGLGRCETRNGFGHRLSIAAFLQKQKSV